MQTKKESPERGVLCTYRLRQAKIGWGRGITEARGPGIFGGFAPSREFKKLENRLLQSALQATPSHFCRSKATSQSQVKEVVKMLLILDPLDPHFNPHPLPWPHRR